MTGPLVHPTCALRTAALAGEVAERQEKSLLAGFDRHWVTLTTPPPVKRASRQFFSACASVLAPGIQSGKRYSGLER